MGSNISLNTGMGLVGGIPSDITIADNIFIDVNPRPHGTSIEARAHNAQGQDGVPPIERLVIKGNTFIRSGGPAMSLIGLQESRIENNKIEVPIRGTAIFKATETFDRQAIMLSDSTDVEVKGNTLIDSEKHSLPDVFSKSNLLGLDSTKSINLDGKQIQDAPKRTPDSKKK
jgi:hypothetical protein